MNKKNHTTEISISMDAIKTFRGRTSLQQRKSAVIYLLDSE